MGLYIPEAYGGAGLGALAFCLAVEELAWACASTAVIYLVQYAAGYPIVAAGTEEQKRRYLPRLAAGRDHGRAVDLRARRRLRRGRDDDDRRAQGRPLRPQRHQDVGDERQPGGRHHALRHGGPRPRPQGRHRVPGRAHLPGLRGRQARAQDGHPRLAHGGAASDATARCRSRTASARKGEGFRVALGALDRSRPAVGAQAVGIAQAALDAAIGYAKERRQFGQPIAAFQGMQFMLADMAMQVHAARLLVHHAAALVDRGATDTRAGVVDGQVLRRATPP